MKKILFIGKINSEFQDTNYYLSRFFDTQACVDNHEMVKGLLRIKNPELVIFNVDGISEENKKIFTELKYNYTKLPVVCIYNREEEVNYGEYYRQEQVRRLIRPVKKEDVLKSVCDALGMELDFASKEILSDKNRKQKILLVDDNPLQLRTLASMLVEKYDVSMATSGMNALAQIGKNRPDMIFLDYDMPMCDGRITLQMIREVDDAKDIPVVFLTGVNDKAHIECVLSLKPAGYLLKPATAEIIYKTIENVLG